MWEDDGDDEDEGEEEGSKKKGKGLRLLCKRAHVRLRSGQGQQGHAADTGLSGGPQGCRDPSVRVHRRSTSTSLLRRVASQACRAAVASAQRECRVCVSCALAIFEHPNQA